MEDYEKTQATIRLMNEIAKGRCSGETEKLYTPEEMRHISAQKPMENNLIYTTRSRQDLDDIWDYISFDLQNLPSAERILNRIMDAAEQLKLFPESGALLSSVAPLDHELYLDERFLVSGKYLIFYHAFRNDIYIDRVLYGGRDYLRVLFRDALQEE